MSETINTENKSYADHLRDRMRIVEEKRKDVIKTALDAGLPEERLAELVADGMNKGELATIIRGTTYRGSGFSLFLIKGEIPASALEINILEHEGEMYGVDIGFSQEGFRSVSEGSASFTIDQPDALLPQMGNDPPDWEFLAKLDAHIPKDGSLAPPRLN